MARLQDLTSHLSVLQAPTVDALVALCETSAPGTQAAFAELMHVLSLTATSFTELTIDAQQVDEYGILGAKLGLFMDGGKRCTLELLFCVDEDDTVQSIVVELTDIQLLLAELLVRFVPDKNTRSMLQPLVGACADVHTRFTVTHRLLPTSELLFDAEFSAKELAFPALTALKLTDTRLRLTRYAANQPVMVHIGARLTPDIDLGSRPPETAVWPAVSITLPISTTGAWRMRLMEPLKLVTAPLAVLSLVSKLFGQAHGVDLTTLHDSMPEPLKVADNLALTEFELSFNPFEGKGIFHSLDLTVRLVNPITLGPFLKIAQAALEFRVDGHVAALRLTGLTVMPGYLWCKVGVDIPLDSTSEDWVLELSGGYQPEASLGDLTFKHSNEPVLSAGFHPAFLELDAINISNFSLAFNPFKAHVSAVSLDLEIDGGVKLPPFLAVEQPEFKLYVDNPFDAKTRQYAGQLFADVTVLGLPFQASAGRQSSGEWQFGAVMVEKGLTLATLEKNSGLPLPQLPPHLALISVDYIAFNVQTGAFDLTFAWDATLPLLLDEAQQPVLCLHLASSLEVSRSRDKNNSKSYNLAFKGQVDVGKQTLTGGVSKTGTDWDLDFGWAVAADAKREDTLGLDSLMHLVGQPQALPALPPELDFRLQGFKIRGELSTTTRAVDVELDVWQWGRGVLRVQTGGASKTNGPLIAAGALIKRSLKISQLPIVGKLLPSVLDVGLCDPWLLVANRPLARQDIQSFAKLLGVTETDDLKEAQFGLGLTLQLADKALPLMLGISPGQRRTQATELDFAPMHPSLVPTPIKAEAPDAGKGEASPNITKWFSLQKSIGPLNVRRIGVRLNQGRLGVLVDGAVQVGGLTLEAEGLGLSSPLDSFSPQFHLSGLGILFDRDPLLVGAALRVCDEDELTAMQIPGGPAVGFAMSGTAVLKLSQFSIAGVGGLCAFADGTTATFVFAELRAPIGGDPSFFITGFSGGLGVNYSLRLPVIGEVWSCPFVAGLYVPGSDGKTPTPLAVLDSITRDTDKGPAWLRPMPGNVWLAAGIRFTTYKMVETNAVAVAVIGSELSFSLMGVCTANLPQDSSSPVACIEVEFQATIQPKTGYIALGGGLTPRSWVMVRECVLSGTVAACWWLNPANPDFVISAGGYHPAFERPQAWPVLNRLGFNWRYGDKVTIKGAVYGALTPCTVMAGGMLDASYESGNLKAWFKAWADFIMRYQPLTFAAEVGMTAGVSYDMDFLLFRSKIKVELSAQLRLAGPPLRGEVILHLYLFDVHVEFGAPPPAPSKPSWLSVKAALLAADAHRIVLNMDVGTAPDQATATPQARLYAQEAAPSAEPSTPQALPGRVSTAGFSMEVGFSAPATLLRVNDATAAQCPPFAVRPCAISDVQGHAWLQIARTDGTQVDASRWVCTPRFARQAAGLWGQPESSERPPINAERLTHALITGIRIAPPAAREAGNPVALDGNKLQLYSTIVVDQHPRLPLPVSAGGIPAATAANGSCSAQLQAFASDAVVLRRQRRCDMLKGLGFALPALDSGSGLAASAMRHYPTEPRIVRLSPANTLL